MAFKRKAITANDQVPEKKSTAQPLFSWSPSSGSFVSQAKVDELIVRFVVGYMEPMSIFEDPSFINLIKGLQPSRKVFTRKTLDGKLLPLYCITVIRHSLE